MIPYAVDPSLHSGEPAPDLLGDGFSPPPHEETNLNEDTATHPVESEPSPGSPQPATPPNPSHLPVEPDFGPALPAAEPEDPGVKSPVI